MIGIKENLSTLSIGSLLDMLHSAITKAAHELERMTKINQGVSTKDVEELREHIEARLEKETDKRYDEQTLKVLDLFLTDKYVIEFIKENSEEWLDFIGAMRNSIHKSGPGEASEADSRRLLNSINKIEMILRN